MGEFKESMEKLGKDLETGFKDLGNSVDIAVDKAKDYLKSEKAAEVKEQAKKTAKEVGESFEQLGKSIGDSFKNNK